MAAGTELLGDKIHKPLGISCLDCSQNHLYTLLNFFALLG